MSYTDVVIKHYTNVWGAKFQEEKWLHGPNAKEYNEIIKLLVFEPSLNRDYWIYATCGMSSERME